MHEADRIHDRLEDRGGFVLWEVFVFLDALGEAAALEELEYDVEEVVVGLFEGLDQFDDIRVVELAEDE